MLFTLGAREFGESVVKVWGCSEGWGRLGHACALRGCNSGGVVQTETREVGVQWAVERIACRAVRVAEAALRIHAHLHNH